MNPYETLGVDPAASPEAIKRAYRKKAKRHHPDSSTGNREKFEAINRASLILLNPERRAKFDATGDGGSRGRILTRPRITIFQNAACLTPTASTTKCSPVGSATPRRGT